MLWFGCALCLPTMGLKTLCPWWDNWEVMDHREGGPVESPWVMEGLEVSSYRAVLEACAWTNPLQVSDVNGGFHH